jgi:hypothetical protein
MEAKLPFVGMVKERQKLLAAFREKQPVVLLGAHGSGKTRLIEEILRHHPGTLYVGWQDTPHMLLAAIARALIASRHPEFERRAKFGAQPETWLSTQTSSHLKALIWNAVEHTPIALIIDGVSRAGFPTHRFLQRLYYTPGVWLSAAACGSTSLGALGRLFWDRRQIVQLAPLSERESLELFEAAADHFRLRGLELEEFREKVLDSACGNPGQIIEMCRLAAQPRYVSGRYIKFTPLRIDTVMKFI